ncbi:metalloregulator ArsR/SmtB family transcription factor [Terrarubrum flagellatum]|uniref:ArsR/SmtB family transcription factor n=1 Tax=Terrirubrum flagellatum TaxID=2895980 RepID=UPI0031454D1D
MLEAAVFKALSDPTRLALFERLGGRELTVVELTRGGAISQPAVSQHLAALRAAGLVSERRHGRNAFYRQAPDGLAPLTDFVERQRRFWPEKIEKLKDVLRDMEP